MRAPQTLKVRYAPLARPIIVGTSRIYEMGAFPTMSQILAHDSAEPTEYYFTNGVILDFSRR